jgi:hypothetical protein
VEKIVTHDVRRFKRLAAGRIDITELPEVVPPQGTPLFEELPP